MKKRLFAKNTCYDLLINYIPELIKTMGGVKDKIMSLFETRTTRIMVKHVSKDYGGGKKPKNSKLKWQLEDTKIKNLRSLFNLKNRK